MNVLAATLPASTLGQRLLFGIPFLAVAVIFGYEWLAYTFGWAPTLSRILNYEQTSRGVGFAVIWGVVGGVAGTLLTFHFAGLLKWWQP